MIRDETLHQRILRDLEGKIVSGEWPPGHRLPFEVDLARDYGCSRMTVNKVMTQLVQNGLIERRKRSGSFVLQPKVSSAVLEIPDVQQDVERQGLPYAYRLEHQAQRNATDSDMRRMELTAPAPILAITCTHVAGHRPFCHEERLINLATVPEALDVDFTTTAPGKWLLQQVPWSTAEHRIGAMNAGTDLARMLGVEDGTACLTMERRTWSEHGPVTHVRLAYPGDRQSLVARFQPAAG